MCIVCSEYFCFSEATHFTVNIVGTGVYYGAFLRLHLHVLAAIFDVPLSNSTHALPLLSENVNLSLSRFIIKHSLRFKGNTLFTLRE